MSAPPNNDFAAASELNLVGQVRTIRSVEGTTVDATVETDEPQHFSNTGPVTGTVWYKVIAPVGTTGPFRIAIPNPNYFPNPDWYYTSAVLWRQRGSGFSGLQYVDDSTNGLNDGLHNNCEGYAQGRDNYMWEFALGAGEMYYIQVATYGVDTVGVGFTLEWCYDPVPEPTELTGSKTSSNCPGTPLTTHGWNIAYFDAISGFAGRFLPGRSVSHAPAMPTVGHAFYVEDVREFSNLHIRRIIVGWTEESGPFLYGYLDPHGWLRTWTVDNEDPIGDGAADMVGGVHQGIVFYDNPTFVDELATIRSIPGAGSTDPTDSWGAPLPGTSIDMAWGGPGRPDSIFGAVFPSVGSPYTVEWDLAGSVLQTVALRSFQWCSLDGTELFGLDSGDLKAYNLSTTATRTVRAGTTGTIVGVRSSSAEIVMSYTTTQIAAIDATTGDRRLLDLPERPSTWAITNGRHWNQFGVTDDGQHLFLGLFYPLTPHPGGASGSRDFVSDIWWMDLDTGVCEHKFFLAHPFHDTYMVFDTVPAPPTTNVRNVRLYRQADVGR